MVKTFASWRDQLLNLIADKVTAAIDKRVAAVLDRIEERLVERLDGAIDRLTDQIPGQLDDKLFDGIVGKLTARLPLLNIPVSAILPFLKGRQ